MLTQDRLKELLSYDARTGVFLRRVSTSATAREGMLAGWIDDMGYVRMQIDGRKYRAHQLAWLFAYGFISAEDIDHANQQRSDNRLCNLRLATRSQNNQNRRLETRNTSGIKGVCWDKRNGKWIAQLMVDKKNKFLGYYDNLFDAVCARKSAEITLHPYRAA